MGDNIICGAIKVLIDLGFDMEKNSAENLLHAINDILEMSKINKDIREELMDAIKENNELVERETLWS